MAMNHYRCMGEVEKLVKVTMTFTDSVSPRKLCSIISGCRGAAGPYLLVTGKQPSTSGFSSLG
ncbi:hypothetical protein E2C01_049801 [Portunus trituberculatus]|uniref:Uncharacterized protein n=1 Tax=Portunus trituberculatus TaxID=210409 RepID=A0A5B7GE44_PORTR|nr:hypothetical protein [Portunus trituberculatus]